MEDALNNHGPGHGGSGGQPRRRARRQPRGAGKALDAALLDVPAARAEMVSYAARLVRDPGYPSEELLWVIADLLATRIESGDVPSY